MNESFGLVKDVSLDVFLSKVIDLSVSFGSKLLLALVVFANLITSYN